MNKTPHDFVLPRQRLINMTQLERFHKKMNKCLLLDTCYFVFSIFALIIFVNIYLNGGY